MSTYSSAVQESPSLLLIDMNRYLYIIAAALLLSGGCRGGQQEAVLGPEDTVEAFFRATASGDMETARTLCDTAAMKVYLDNWTAAWEELEKQDSSALRIAAGILSESSFAVVKTEKDGERRAVTYTLESEENTKTRKAVLKKEEGEWRVEEVTDVQ